MLISKAAILILAVLLGACGTATKLPVTGQSHNDWAQYQLHAGRINSWDLHGRAAIFVDEDVHNIGLNWQRNEDEFVLTLEAPFGQGVFRLESSREPDSPVKLSLPDGQTVFAESAEAALERVLGWSIPVSGLESWIRGLPQRTDTFSHDLNGDGRLKSLLQDSWRVNYLEYFDFTDAEDGLPRKLYLKHDRLALKIVIDRWQKPATDVNAINPELFPDFN